jgi:hypothetical protein
MSDAPEALPALPELQEDLVYCGVCNVNGSEVSETTTKPDGWSDDDWGFTCPTCKADLDRQDDGILDNGFQGIVKIFKGGYSDQGA